VPSIAPSLVELLNRPPTLGTLIVLLAGVVLLNTLLTTALLLAWERMRRSRRLREALRRELRHLRLLATEDGVQRKAGLLRDLNALGAVPEELEDCELERADLRGVRLAGCSLRGARMAGADLQGAVLDGADLFGTGLAGANLALASLRGANLRGCDLDGAALIKTDLRDANLHRADLVHADLHGAILQGARLVQARFARPEEGAYQLTLHPSVEDWIRERLDAEGRYQERQPQSVLALIRAG
jgi:uncharacterized protein YjbI with pentapeptide repeats